MSLCYNSGTQTRFPQNGHGYTQIFWQQNVVYDGPHNCWKK